MQRNFFQYGVVVFITLTTIIIQSADGNLRPSDHGLDYQKDASPPPTQNGDGQDMLSFFGSTPSSEPMPEAQSISDDAWWSAHGDGRSRDIRRDHVRMALLVASAVCGTAGIVLLVVSGVVFIIRRRERKAEAGRLSSNFRLHTVSDK
ncbi:hypothetical protein CDL12_16048 [Handroanthus impetiginosus]|uniref:Uncharacterized protein n=1 Tax=Handroanthus impetiginosus TaxID=429701 RepID=A0A2G9H1E9_9LAMI|nr:hypothetical protein CDL12_16048 [Handroanthus impetiginosus]